jgi:hypothetical protein
MSQVSKGIALILIVIVVLYAVCLLAYNGVNAQISQSTAWSKTYPGFGEISQTVIQTADGGYALLCTSYNFNDPNYASGVFYIVKVDSNGNQQWNSSYRGSIYQVSSGQYLIQTPDNGFAAIAEYQNKLTLTKIDQYGKEQWRQTYAGAGTCVASAIIQTSDGGFALLSVSNFYTGHVFPPIGYSESVWLVKTSSSGDLQWSKTYGLGDANSLIQTSDGGYAMAGQTLSPNPQYLLIKADSRGNLEWNTTYYHEDENSLCSVVQTSDGGYALGGWIWLRSNGGGPNMAITKTDSLGNEQWTNYYGKDLTFAMTKTIDGGFALASLQLVKVDNAGNQQWRWTIGFSGQPSCLIQTYDGGYALCGYSGYNSSDPWLTKIDVANPNQTPQPSNSQSIKQTPSVPELSWLVILPLLLSVFSVAVIVRYRKTSSLSRKKWYNLIAIWL